ncbi:28443_t:CDS:2, partial [Racocetra persica]
MPIAEDAESSNTQVVNRNDSWDQTQIRKPKAWTHKVDELIKKANYLSDDERIKNRNKSEKEENQASKENDVIGMMQSSKILIFVLYDILITLTSTLADVSSESSDININDANDIKSKYTTTNNDVNYVTSVRLDSPENINDFKLVVITTYVMAFFNTIGCSYVFYRSWLQWKISSKSLSMIFRLPFYTAIA